MEWKHINNEFGRIIVELPAAMESTKRTRFHMSLMKDSYAHQQYDSGQVYPMFIEPTILYRSDGDKWNSISWMACKQEVQSTLSKITSL